MNRLRRGPLPEYGRRLAGVLAFLAIGGQAMPLFACVPADATPGAACDAPMDVSAPAQADHLEHPLTADDIQSPEPSSTAPGCGAGGTTSACARHCVTAAVLVAALPAPIEAAIATPGAIPATRLIGVVPAAEPPPPKV